MKRVWILLFAVLLTCAGCGETKYYHTAVSSASEESVNDPTPAYVLGKNGFYDTVADAEYIRETGVTAKERGELLYEDGETAIYTVKGIHESYMLCDAQRNVYRNTDKPWSCAPGSTGWADAYPALSYRGN